MPHSRGVHRWPARASLPRGAFAALVLAAGRLARRVEPEAWMGLRSWDEGINQTLCMYMH
jgi:hypothetical protein